ncbi:MAG: glycosyltransferase family 4 protein [Nitrospinae bacterium]|nr:glycosyltransferase family 4 protein [Nitrospinota bacterium]
MKRCRIVTSWPLEGGFGSGTSAVANGVIAALRQRGVGVETLDFTASSENYLLTTFQRLAFGYRIGDGMGRRERMPNVAFDQDGFFFPHNVPYACMLQALYADIIRFERGLIGGAVRLLARMERRTAEKAAAVFVSSEYTARKAAALYGLPAAKIRVMNNGLFLDDWRAWLSAAPPRTDARPTLLCVARLYRRKSVDRLIADAWPLVLKKVPEARLMVAGDGLEFERLCMLVRERGLTPSVEMLGHIPPGPALAPLYRAADVFCLPSMQENFGVVLLEAMAAGLPIAAFRAGAVPEVSRDGSEALLAEEDDFPALAERIAHLLQNAGERRRLGAAGVERVERHYRWERVIAPLTEWLDRA